VARGLYRRPGLPLRWQSIVYSLKELGCKFHIGGSSSLVEQGYGHFISFNHEIEVHLYASKNLPSWLRTWHTTHLLPPTPFHFVLHQQAWLDTVPEECFIQRNFGQWDWPLCYAAAELAVLEILLSLQSETDFMQMDRWFESLTTLSPTRLQLLLTLCPNVKAKRLFGWFAERHGHAWFQKLDWSQVALGSGKRALVQSGRYNKRWKITVPHALENNNSDGSEHPVF
jgi:hypothetical protein